MDFYILIAISGPLSDIFYVYLGEVKQESKFYDKMFRLIYTSFFRPKKSGLISSSKSNNLARRLYTSEEYRFFTSSSKNFSFPFLMRQFEYSYKILHLVRSKRDTMMIPTEKIPLLN